MVVGEGTDKLDAALLLKLVEPLGGRGGALRLAHFAFSELFEVDCLDFLVSFYLDVGHLVW